MFIVIYVDIMMTPQDIFNFDATSVIYSLPLIAMVCCLFFTRKKRFFPSIQKWIWIEEDEKCQPCHYFDNIDKEAETIPKIQKRFRDLVSDIDSKNFKEVLVNRKILSAEFFDNLEDLRRKQRAEILLLNLFMSPRNWVPIFMNILQQKYQKSYRSIVELDGDRQSIANGETWCNSCTRKIINYTINDSIQTAKVPLDGGKLIPLLLEEQVITPTQYEEVIVQKCLSDRTVKLQSILDDDYTSTKCLGVFQQAIIDAGYEDCHRVLKNIISDWQECPNDNDLCNGKKIDEDTFEKQTFGDLRERRQCGYNVSSKITDIGSAESDEKTVIMKFEVNAEHEEKHDQILREFNARKQSLNKCINDLGEVISITKGCIAIVVRCNKSDSSYGDVAIEILNRMLSGNLPWDLLDKGNIKVQLCVSDFPRGKDSKLLQDKIGLLHHVPVILEEMDALDFEDVFLKRGLFEKELFQKMFDIENLCRQDRMLKLLQFILLDERRIVFDCFISVIQESCNKTLLPLRNSLSQKTVLTMDTIGSSFEMEQQQNQNDNVFHSIEKDAIKEYKYEKEHIDSVGGKSHSDDLFFRQIAQRKQIHTRCIKLFLILFLVLPIIILLINLMILQITDQSRVYKMESNKYRNGISNVSESNASLLCEVGYGAIKRTQLVFYTNITGSKYLFIQNNSNINYLVVTKETNRLDFESFIFVIFMLCAAVILLFYLCYRTAYSFKKANEKGKQGLHMCKSSIFYSGDDFVYDAFISYDQRDTEWVFKNLKKLEATKLKLRYTHEADFIPGTTVVRNLFESIQKSRSVIVVISEPYISDVWSYLIMDLAETVMQERSVKRLLVLCRYEDEFEFTVIYNTSDWTVLKPVENRVDEKALWEYVAKFCRKP